MKSEDQLLREFAQGFAAIPKAKERFIKAAHHLSGRSVSSFYNALTECIDNLTEVMLLNDRISHIACYRSGRVAALIRRFTYEMRAEGIKIQLGNTNSEKLVDAINYYNSIDVTSTEVLAKIVFPDKDFANTEQRVQNILFHNIGTNTMSKFFDKFLNNAVAKPTFIFGQLTDGMTNDEYLGAIRRLQGEIKQLDDIKDSKKVDAKVVALKKELKEVTGLYDDSDG